MDKLCRKTYSKTNRNVESWRTLPFTSATPSLPKLQITSLPAGYVRPSNPPTLSRHSQPAKQPKVIPMSLPAKVVNLATCILSCAKKKGVHYGDCLGLILEALAITTWRWLGKVSQQKNATNGGEALNFYGKWVRAPRSWSAVP